MSRTHPCIIAVANQKGGVGKTTTTVNVAASLAQLGQRVLLVDLDPQGNATMSCGIQKHDLNHSVYHVLLGEKKASKVIKTDLPCRFDVLPSNRHLAGAEVELVKLEAREHRLRTGLQPILADYDYVLIDCPPALNLLTLNGFVSAQTVLIPMQCEYFALEGLADLVNTLRQLKKALNPQIEIEGLLRTMFDARSTLAQNVSTQLRQHFADKVLETIIPRNVRLAEAPSYGLPVLQYDKNARGARAYLQLAEELLQRHGKVDTEDKHVKTKA